MVAKLIRNLVQASDYTDNRLDTIGGYKGGDGERDDSSQIGQRFQ